MAAYIRWARRKFFAGRSSGHRKLGIAARSSNVERQYAIAKQFEHAVKHFGQSLLAPTVRQHTDAEQQFAFSESRKLSNPLFPQSQTENRSALLLELL
ncbi:hypothetical protein [Sinorhizobium meliloti]|uniref:hypothetical protein n=1 Tax=Rhizobium meliloti TaxID=382 RepID=UPI0013E2E145|nr:hypothetical protein [Sinorhizobium meliloti]